MTKVRLCSDTKTVQTHFITTADITSQQRLHGGRIMKMIDICAGISFTLHSESRGVTASMDSLNFFESLEIDHIVRLESYVTGTGRYSVEIFVKVMGEDFVNDRSYLAATAFLTFVSVAGEGEERKEMPRIQPVSEEERYISNGYEARVAARKAKRQSNHDFNQNIKMTQSWDEE